MSINVGAKISVCLLTYNHVEVVESSLKTILDQTISDYEVIASDDCSTDGTWEKIAELARTDARIKPVRTLRNMGMPGNANHAVSMSNRPYVALLHHDDLYRSDLLEKWAEVLERYPGVAFVFNSYGVFQSGLVYREEISGECVDGHWLLDEHLLPRWGCAVRGTAMIRRDAWEQVGGMREQFGLLSDIDLWMRLAMRWQVGYISEPVIIVRHQRPEGYPDDYGGNGWSWRRQRLLYEIHAANRRAYWRLDTLVGRLKWWRFRLRMSGETAKWLAYAVVRRKPAIIATSQESVTAYDLWPVRLLRWVLQKLQRT